jgi:isoamylase
MRCFGMLLDGRAQETGVKRRGSDATLLLVYNAHFDVVNFTLPSVPDGTSWLGLIDTNQPEAQLGAFSFGENYLATGRSLLAFGLTARDHMTGPLRHGIGSILDATETPL